MKDWRDRLRALAGDAVLFDEPLASRVAFKIGGPADALVRVSSPELLRGVLALAGEAALPVAVLGTGSNVLISDRGVRGLVLRLSGELADIHLAPNDDGTAEAEIGAGALNAHFVALALNLGYAGVEFLATIPGTFGGALIMNAGAHGGEIGPFVKEVRLIDHTRSLVARSGAECGFEYRKSGFLPGEVLTGATLSLKSGDTAKARAHLKEMRDHRRKTQPIGQPNAGSIFKNPPGNYAGRLIEACGLKGTRAGGATISELHANFIVNEGNATAMDVVTLARIAQAAVRERFGIALEWEVKRIGDWNEEELR